MAPPHIAALLPLLLALALRSVAASGALGVDLGSESSLVATARRGGIDVLVNEASRRSTLSVVGFDARQRLHGQDAAAQQVRSPHDCVADVKGLLGKRRLEAAKRALRRPCPELVSGESADSPPLLEVQLRGEARRFSATQLLALLLHRLQRSAEREAGEPITECTIAVPLHFGSAQRRAVLDAAEIAGLKSCRLISDGAAAALDYALGRPQLPKDTDHHVAFVDAGHAGVQVCIVRVRSESLHILGHAYAPDAGGAVRGILSHSAHAQLPDPSARDDHTTNQDLFCTAASAASEANVNSS